VGGLDTVWRRYFIGVGSVVLYAATAAYLGLGLVLGLSRAVVLALLTGALEMIAFVGPLTAATIAGIACLHKATGI
jgi:predicted PurR-regulated permease PerM